MLFILGITFSLNIHSCLNAPYNFPRSTAHYIDIYMKAFTCVEEQIPLRSHSPLQHKYRTTEVEVVSVSYQ